MATTPDLQDAVATVINRSLAGLDTAASFVKEQLPDIIAQLLTWTIALNITKMALWLVLFLVMLIVLWRMRKQDVPYVKDGSPTVGGIIRIVLMAATAVVFGAVVIPAIIETVKVIYAPKLFLIDYVKDLAAPSARR